MSFMLISISVRLAVNPGGRFIHLISKHVSMATPRHYISLTSFLVQKVQFENEPLHPESVKALPQSPMSPSTPSTPSPRRSRLSRFLSNLTLRANDPSHDLNDPSFR